MAKYVFSLRLTKCFIPTGPALFCFVLLFINLPPSELNLFPLYVFCAYVRPNCDGFRLRDINFKVIAKGHQQYILTCPEIWKMLFILQVVMLLWNYPNLSAQEEILSPVCLDESLRSMGKKTFCKSLL